MRGNHGEAANLLANTAFPFLLARVCVHSIPPDADDIPVSPELEQVHHGWLAEVVGFASRWVLLAAGAGLIALVAWQSLLATVGVSQDVRGRFIQPDVLCLARLPEGRYCSQYGVLIGAASAGEQPVVLAVRSSGQIEMGWANTARTFVVYWPGCEVGLTPARFVGAPYCPLAFERTTASVLGVQPGRAVALIDARLMPDDPNEPAWVGLLEVLKRRGEAALFAVGPVERYQAAARRRERDVVTHKLPLLYRPEEPPYVLRRAAVALGRKRTRENMIVVTADAGLAESAAEAGFTVHLIAAAAAPAASQGKIVPHADLRDLRDSLRAEPR